MDIWLIDAAAAEPAVNLTADSPEGDFAPAWSPDGRFIAFASWRPEEPESTKPSNKDLYLLEMDSGQVTRLAGSAGGEEWPAWSPGGSELALVIDNLGDRELFMLAVSESTLDGAPPQPVTWLGRTDGPVWSPDGQAVAGVFHRWDGEIITVQVPGNRHQLPRQITGLITVQGRLTWHETAANFGHPVATLADTDPSARYVERIAASDVEKVEPFNLVRLNDVETGTPWLADTVDDSFLGWRYELRNEVGYDFLGKLSDAARDVASYTDTSQ
jgi:dipeptidyl aminopeptidase/acylaminoacyl peptidase